MLDEALDYDANGNVAALTDGATGQFQRGNRDMVYDGLDRLTSTLSPMFGTATYGYDVLDNLSRVNVSGGPNPRDHWYVYDGANRLTNLTSGSDGPTVVGLGYDVRGNLANKNGQGYSFDHGNRLRGVLDLEGYRYDGLGRRVLMWSQQGLGNILSQYDQAGRLVYQDDQRRMLAVGHFYLGDTPVARRQRTLPGGTNPTVTYLHTDALGSVAAETDVSRMVTQRSEYEPYGDLLNRNNDNRPGYTGHVMDALSGLTYMQQRYYDPGIGMFLSVDPVTAYSNPIGQFHRYRYANNNPYRFTDPDGRWAEDLFIGVPSIILGAKSFVDNASAGNIGAAAVDVVGIVADGAAILTPGVPGGAGLGIKAARTAEAAANTTRVADKGGDGARFVGQPDGTVVDTRATPPGSYDQPNGSRTDILQREDHGAGHSHTHDKIVNTDPNTGQTYVNGEQKPGRPVTYEEVRNIESGAATSSPSRGR